VIYKPPLRVSAVNLEFDAEESSEETPRNMQDYLDHLEKQKEVLHRSSYLGKPPAFLQKDEAC